MRVPAADVPEFLRGHFHALARSITVASRDGSFTPPPAPLATLVLDARFEPHDVLRLAWHWEYADGRTSPVEASAADAAAATPSSTTTCSPASWTSSAGCRSKRSSCAASTPPSSRPSGCRGSSASPSTSGLRIDVTGERPDYREAHRAAAGQGHHGGVATPDWFDLGVVITVGGKAVPFMPLFRALAKGQKRLLLVDKTYLSLNQPIFEPLRELIEEAGTLAEWETGVRIHRSQTSLWADFEDLADVAEPAVEWRETVAGLERGEVEELPHARRRSRCRCVRTSSRGSDGSPSCTPIASAGSSPTTWGSARRRRRSR